MSAGSLRFGVIQISDEGTYIQFSEMMKSLARPGDETAEYEKELESHFPSPITGEFTAFKIGNKVHVRGHFEADYLSDCDRCGEEAHEKISSPWEVFLMPTDQFSEADADGGKFRHGKPGEDDHDDTDLSEYDGKTVDLREFLREEIVLLAPLQVYCAPDCKGICLNCGKNLNKEKCIPGCPTVPIEVAPVPIGE